MLDIGIGYCNWQKTDTPRDGDRRIGSSSPVVTDDSTLCGLLQLAPWLTHRSRLQAPNSISTPMPNTTSNTQYQYPPPNLRLFLPEHVLECVSRMASIHRLAETGRALIRLVGRPFAVEAHGPP